MKMGKKLRIIALKDLKEDSISIVGAFLGAPLVGIEKITNGYEVKEAIETIRTLIPNQDVTALASVEIGGMNSIAPLYTAALMDLPMVDVDGMGRAYPEV